MSLLELALRVAVTVVVGIAAASVVIYWPAIWGWAFALVWHPRELTPEQEALAVRLRRAADEIYPPMTDREHDDAFTRLMAHLEREGRR